MKEITKSELGLTYGHLPEEQRKFMEANADTVLAIVNKALAGAISIEEADAKMKSALDAAKKVSDEEASKLKSDVDSLTSQLKKLGEEVEKAKQKGVDVNPILAKANEAIDQMFESEKWKSFVNGLDRSAKGFEIKEISMSGNYTGTHLITAQSRDIVSEAKTKTAHIRDFSAVLPGDPEMLNFAWQQIYDVDNNARYVSENGMLPESSFKVKEEISGVKRVGHHYKISKLMLKSRIFVRAFVLTQAVAGVLNAEDSSILYGDGSGDNLKGITKYEGCKPVETIIGTAIIQETAGSVSKLEARENGVVVELKKAYDVLQEGMKITFTGATTNTQLNATFDVIKLNDRQILLHGCSPLTGTTQQQEADAAAMTVKVQSGAYKSIDEPNSYDALQTAVAVMTYAQYRPTLILLNPMTINSISCEKQTNGNRLEVVMNFSNIGGAAVVPCVDIPVGKYMIGDFVNGAKLIEYTGLTLQWADDVETKLKNQVVLIAEEEVILAVENPWAFAYGTISALKDAIKKA